MKNDCRHQKKSLNNPHTSNSAQDGWTIDYGQKRFKLESAEYIEMKSFMNDRGKKKKKKKEKNR